MPYLVCHSIVKNAYKMHFQHDKQYPAFIFFNPEVAILFNTRTTNGSACYSLCIIMACKTNEENIEQLRNLNSGL